MSKYPVILSVLILLTCVVVCVSSQKVVDGFEVDAVDVFAVERSSFEADNRVNWGELVKIAKRKPLDGKTIILDAGHDSVNDNIYEGYSEADTMLRLSYKIKDRLESQGATVLLTRPDEAEVSLPVRVATINLESLNLLLGQKGHSWETVQAILKGIRCMQQVIDNPDEFSLVYFNYPWSPEKNIAPELERIFELQSSDCIQDKMLVLSLHSNATPLPIDESLNGADFYYAASYSTYNYGEYTNVRSSILLGQLLFGGFKDTDIKPQRVLGGNWFIIREHNLPGLLVENGYHTNVGDRGLLSSEIFLDELVNVYTQAILSYFEQT